jgi:hypothetical protein
MNKLIVALLTVSLSACTAMPMDPAKFKRSMSGKSLGAVEYYTVPLAFNAVAASLPSAARRCLNYTASGILTSHGYVPPSRRVRAEVRILKPGKAQLVVQQDAGSAIFDGGKKPEGGWYTFVAGIAPASASSTNVTMYGDGDMWSNIKPWASGRDTSCHNGLL